MTAQIEDVVVTQGNQAERAVMVCPQCEGEGGYPDGLDEAACHTECPRCGSNGWIVDVAALASLPSQDSFRAGIEAARLADLEARLEDLERLKAAGDVGECDSCGGLNISCPDGCERDPKTGELIASSPPVSDELRKVVERIQREDAYLVDYLLGWAGLAEPQPWGAATSFALEVAAGYRLIRGESDASLTERGKEVATALSMKEDGRG